MANYTSKFTGSEIDRRLTDVDNKIPNTEKGRSNGVATLDSSGKVPTSQLPSYVDDVLEYSSRSAFPSTGEGGKIYLATDKNEIYRWTGSTYVSISSASTGGLVLGETSGTAYEGSKGKTNADDIITLQNDVANLTTGKQDKLVSGMNIKTLNGTSLLGSGDIPISGGGTISIENVNLFLSETQSSIGEIVISVSQFFITELGLTEENQQEWWAQQKENGNFGSILIGFIAMGLDVFVQKTNSAVGGKMVSYDDTKLYAQLGATLEAFYVFSKDEEARANSNFSFTLL